MNVLKTIYIALLTLLTIALYIPHSNAEAVIETPATSTVNTRLVGKINLNTADELTLTQLPGIGKSKAQAIIAYRKKHGKFVSLEQLKDVKGIGQGIVSKIESSVILKQ